MSEPEPCPLLCSGHFSEATYVCDTCGYDPYGYYSDDDLEEVFLDA